MPRKEENSVESNAPEERKRSRKAAVIAEKPPENHYVASSSHTQGRIIAMPQTA